MDTEQLSAETPAERLARHDRERAEHEARKAEALRSLEEKRALESELRAQEFRVSEEREVTKCLDCGYDFVAHVLAIGGKPMVAMRVCPDCRKAREEAAEAAELDRIMTIRRERWLDLCPEGYQDTCPQRLIAELEASREGIVFLDNDPSHPQGRKLNPAALVATVLNWPEEGPGLALIGATGRGKTRLLLKLFERYNLLGHKVSYVNCAAMSDTIGALLGESARAGNDYITRLERAPVLLLDDLGKAKMTARGEEALYRIVEARKAYNRRTFFTTNTTGEVLRKQFSPDAGMPIIRRLRDMTQQVIFVPAQIPQAG